MATASNGPFWCPSAIVFFKVSLCRTGFYLSPRLRVFVLFDHRERNGRVVCGLLVIRKHKLAPFQTLRIISNNAKLLGIHMGRITIFFLRRIDVSRDYSNAVRFLKSRMVRGKYIVVNRMRKITIADITIQKREVLTTHRLERNIVKSTARAKPNTISPVSAYNRKVATCFMILVGVPVSMFIFFVLKNRNKYQIVATVRKASRKIFIPGVNT